MSTTNKSFTLLRPPIYRDTTTLRHFDAGRALGATTPTQQITASEFVANPEIAQQKALLSPLEIREAGRVSHILLSADDYRNLQKSQRNSSNCPPNINVAASFCSVASENRAWN